MERGKTNSLTHNPLLKGGFSESLTSKYAVNTGVTGYSLLAEKSMATKEEQLKEKSQKQKNKKDKENVKTKRQKSGDAILAAKKSVADPTIAAKLSSTCASSLGNSGLRSNLLSASKQKEDELKIKSSGKVKISSATQPSMVQKPSLLNSLATKSSLTSNFKLGAPTGPHPKSTMSVSLSTKSNKLMSSLHSGLGGRRGHVLPSTDMTKGSLLLTGTLSKRLGGTMVTNAMGTIKSSLMPSSVLHGISSNSEAANKADRKKPGHNVQGNETTVIVEIPEYYFEQLDLDIEEENIPRFLPPEKDISIIKSNVCGDNVMESKRTFINAVSSSLLKAPDFKDVHDVTRHALMSLADSIAHQDAEFVLKLALYTRRELNIRTTANFLLAFAANNPACRPYMKKYFQVSVQLPSDWIDVAEMYQAFHDRTISSGALPAVLRRVMSAKFPDFDQYQLAKYNKEKSRLAKQKPKITKPAEDSSSDSDEEDEAIRRQLSALSNQSETEEELELKTFTLKQLIRKLHIVEPVENVMCLLGKKYPDTWEDFYKSKLPGEWDQTRAGKRMKLPVPETWETQVSMRGNKAEVWQELIDHKKLPFMAMLRNLRNMIKAGMSEKHHAWVLKKLTDQRSVINSKQFPFRFFSAYQILDALDSEFDRNQALLIEAAVEETSGRGQRVVRGRGRGRGRGGGRMQGRMKKTKEVLYDKRLVQRYRKALNTAVKIATVHNVAPIKGTTLIFCNLSPQMDRPCTAARGLGKPRTVSEVGTLLGLMCKYSCEESKLIAYGNESHLEIELEKGTILDNMDSVLKSAVILNDQPGLKGGEQTRGHIPKSVLNDLLKDKMQVDNVIILSDGLNLGIEEGDMVMNFLDKYRRLVNPNLLFVSVDLSAATCGLDAAQPKHPNDIFIAGYSDQILRFIAGRGDSGQVNHVDKIDLKYNLKSVKKEGHGSLQRVVQPALPLAVLENKPRWRTVRVFISSTFLDMHGERDLLTRFVFPELRARAKSLFVNLFEVDLRWGVTEETTRTHRTLELCLSEVANSQFFVGILGHRYGWVPKEYTVPDLPHFDWVKDYPQGASVTEMEIQQAFRTDATNPNERLFFYIRDESSHRDIPKDKRSVFGESKYGAEMFKLKEFVRGSGAEVFDGYPYKWGGVVDGKPMLAGLEEFGSRVLNNLWNAVQKFYPKEFATVDEISHYGHLHTAFMESRQQSFVGRKAQMKMCLDKINDMKSGLLVITGKPGCGKTSLMASVVQSYVESSQCDSGLNVLVHFVGAAPGSTNITATLTRLCHEMNRRFSLSVEVPQEYKNLVLVFSEMLAMCSYVNQLLLVFDGVEMLDDSNQARDMTWVPQSIPENVLLVFSTVDKSECHNALSRQGATVVNISGLDLWDKPVVVRSTLAEHRKELDESPFNNQVKLLLSKRDATNPLFLKLACEELRVFGLYEKITEKLKSLPHTVPQLLQDILARLETDHGTSLVAAALSLLACARTGLLENELYTLLSYQQQLKPKFEASDVIHLNVGPADMLPTAVFAPLIRSLKTFLRPVGSDNNLSLAHADILRAIHQRYFKGSATEQEMNLHKLLAGYFIRTADPHNSHEWKGTSQRAFSELPYHLACAGCYKELEATLCNLCFIRSKCRLGLAGQLMEDFIAKGSGSRSLERYHKKFVNSSNVQEYRLFVSRNLHILASNPDLTLQQALNEPKSTKPALDVLNMINTKSQDGLGLIEWLNKPDMADMCTRTLTGFTQPVCCVSISADSYLFACGTEDCVVKLYELQTGKELKTFTGHSDQITDLCFIGQHALCSSSADETLSLWNIHEGHRIAVMKGHTRRVQSCCSDGTNIVSAGWDRNIYVWKGKNGEKVHNFYDSSPVNCVAFHPEGQLIVTGSWDSTLKIWDVFNRTKKAVLRGHSSSIRDVAYSPSGRHIASAALDGEVKLWSATTGVQVGNMTGHSLPINRLTFTPTGQQLVTVSDDQKIKIWSGQLGQPVNCLGHEDYGPATCCALVKNGSSVIVGYHEGHIRRFTVETGTLEYEEHPHSKSVRALAVADDEEFMVTGSDDGYGMLIYHGTGMVFGELPGHTKPILAVAISPATSGYIIALASEDCTTTLHKKFPSQSYPARPRYGPWAELHGHVGPVTGCSFNNDGTQLVTSSRDMSLMIWDVQDCLQGNTEPTQVLHACHADWINGCVWSNTGDFIVTGSNDFNLKLWDVKNKKEKVKFTGHVSALNGLAYKYGCIVSCSSDGSVKVWSHKGTEITTLYGHKQRVNACDIFVKLDERPDTDVDLEKTVTDWAAEVETVEWKQEHEKSKLAKDTRVKDVLVASCSDDGSVWVWKPLMGNDLATLQGHSDRVLSVAASSRGDLVTSALDSTIKMWQPKLEEYRQTDGHSAEVTGCAWSCKGTYAATASRDGTVKIWTCPVVDEKPSTDFQCVHTLKAHEKPIVALVFSSSNDMFVTACEDSVNKWQILEQDNKVSVKITRTLAKNLCSPVSALECANNDIVYGSWDGGLTLLKEYPLQVKAVTVEGHKDWVLNIKQHDNQVLVSTGADQMVIVWIVKNGSLTKIYSKSLSHSEMPSSKQPWLVSCCITGLTSRNAVFTGDSEGQLTMHMGNLQTIFKKKIHAEDLTAIRFIRKQMITASADKTIKIWDDADKGQSLKQVGQIFCAVPVTCLDVQKDDTVVVCGDLLGNVKFLKWLP